MTGLRIVPTKPAPKAVRAWAVYDGHDRLIYDAIAPTRRGAIDVIAAEATRSWEYVKLALGYRVRRVRIVPEERS